MEELTLRQMQEGALNILKKLDGICREQGITAIMVIHDLNLALRFCDRFLLLRHGSVYRCGGAEILDRQALLEVYGVNAEVVELHGHRLVLVDGETT